MIAVFLLIASSSPRFFHNAFLRTRKARGRAALMPLLALAFTWALFGGEATVLAATPAATTTALAVTVGGASATSVSSGSVVTLTAIVKAGATAVTVGQVNFCDASATYCTDIHILGTAQLTSAGTAVYKFRPGIGSHSYKAVFLGTASMLASSSSASALTVTGTIPPLGTTATMNQTGGWGAYALTATVTETGNTAAPTGLISFLDTNHGNAVLGTGALGTATRGVNWTTVNTSAPGVAGVLCAVADLNGDGIPDLFIKDYFGTYDVLLGNGDGTFTVVGSPFGPYSETGSFAVGDFNNDGIPDVAAINAVYYAPSSTITIFLGNGDGTFAVAAASPSIGLSPSAIATADIDGDGNADLVVVQEDASGNGQVVPYFGKGDGTFTESSSVTSVASTASSILPSDLNGDGKTDLVLTGVGSAGIAILLGNGDGTFTAAASLAQAGEATASVADVNNDGIPDLVFPAATTSYLTVFLGNGDGTFTEAPSSPNVNVTVGTLAIADFNQDGIPDILYSYSSTASVLFGKGDGSFVQAAATLAYSYDFDASLLVAADFNGDGWPDVLTEDGNSRTVIDSLTTPTETAKASATVSIAAAGAHLADASYSGDSNYSASTSGTLSLWGVPPATTTTLTLTSGGSPATSVAPGTVVTFTATVAAGGGPVTAGQVNFCDAAGASCTDIHLLGSAALTSGGTATLKYVPGPGTHSYKAEFVQDGYGLGSSSAASSLSVGPAPAPVYSNATSITSSGFPGDYSLTATVFGLGGPAVPTGTVSFLDTSFGNTSLGTATLGSSSSSVGWLVVQTPSASGYGEDQQVTSDFNGDGIPDLAVLTQTPAPSTNLGVAAVAIFFGKGDGTFTSGPTSQTSLITYLSDPSMAVGDFNGDGKPDLAIVSYTDASPGFAISAATLLGNGDGTFVASPTSTINQNALTSDEVYPVPIVSADFNGDGAPDIAIVNQNGNGQVVVALGNGDGTFVGQLPIAPPGISFFGQIVAGDFNGDGIPDMAPGLGSNTTTVLLGKGDGTFSPVTSPINFSSYSRVAADFNGDGILDLALAGGNGVQIALGKGDGTFHEGAASTFAASNSVTSLVAADFNQDGHVDLVGIDNVANQIVLLIGAGDGTFSQESSVTNPALESVVNESLTVGDFNGDGFPDLAMPSLNPQGIYALLTEQSRLATATVNNIAPIGAGTHNVEASYAGDSNYGASVSAATVALTAGLAPVAFSPASGTYTSAQTVTLSESIPGSTIYYEAYGLVNTTGFVPYTGPIQLNEGGFETIQAYATETGYQQSNYTTANYTLNLPAAPAPTFSPAAGSYSGAQTVTISDAAAGATIYYTTNGAPPSVYATQYAGPITVSSSETLAAAAAAPGYSLSAPAVAQYLIGTSPTSLIYSIAGNGSYGYSGDGGPALLADLNGPASSLLDSAGNLYIADSGNNVVRKVAASTGVITTIAGNGTGGYSGDNGPATSAQLYYPIGLALDGQSNLYIADSENSVVRKVAAATGVITTVAGNGTIGYSGDGGPATSAELYYPESVALDSTGNLYIADSENNVVRKVNANGGTISTVAGSGLWGYSGDGGSATAAQLRYPRGLALDSLGNLYIADVVNQVIRKVTAATGVISTFAGTGFGAGAYYGGYSGDGGPATSAQLNNPESVAFDNSGNLYIADTYNQVIREVASSTGIISTVAGGAPECYSLSGDGGPARSAALCSPQSVFADRAGNLYIPNEGRIQLVTAPGAVPSAAAVAPTFSVAAGTYASPQTVTIADSTPGAAIYVTLDGSTPTTASQGYNGPIQVSGNVTIQAIAVGPGYLASAPSSAAYTITSPPTAVIRTVAGTGVSGFSGSGGPATSAQVGSLAGVAVDGAGNFYFADTTNNVVWEVAAKTGIASVVAGNGTPGYSGDGGAATSALLNGPSSVAVDGSGNLYIADTHNNVIRKVTAATGAIATFAGDGQPGYVGNLGDGGPAVNAQLNAPGSVVLDNAGNLYIADTGNNRVRLVTASTGVITTVAGNGSYAASGDGGPATSAGLYYPNALALDNSGNLYVACVYSGRVRKVVLSSGIITTFAGDGNEGGSSGDGGPAIAAEIYPQGLAVDSAGNLYIADWPSVRAVSAAAGIITRVAGNGYYGYSGDGGSATIASLYAPSGIAFDGSGNLYIADSYNYRVREVSPPAPAATPAISPASGTYPSPQTATITDSTPGAVIYYTTDGTSPSNASSVYAGPVAIPATTTLKAVAFAPGSAQSAVASATYTIIPIGAAAATVTLTPSAATITDEQPLSVAVSVAGASGQSTPTGSVTLAGGSYSSQQSLASGAATFTIPAGTLAGGADTLTATYSGDATYAAASGTTTVTVAPVLVTAPNPSAVAPGASATATATFSAGSAYSGTMNLACALTASPTGAQSLPTCSLSPASITIASGGTATATLTVNTTAASGGSALLSPESRPWKAWSGGGVLALALLFGVPLRRRRKALMMVALLGAVVGGMVGCGAGGSTKTSPPIIPATTAGSYTFSLTGTDASNAKITASTNITVTVQ